MERVLKENGNRNPATARRMAQRKFQEESRGGIASRINDSPLMAAQRRKLQSLFGSAAQLQQEPAPKPNHTGLPDNLKSGIENLSGMSMDHVRVHYNSSQPAQLNALAYTQGTDIHVAPGQEQHLPHEAWHVVQQAQGRVQPTMQMKNGIAVNEDKGLEQEADVMGQRVIGSGIRGNMNKEIVGQGWNVGGMVAQFKELSSDCLNVAGEDHDQSSARRDKERDYARGKGDGGYWEESEFTHGKKYGDPPILRAIYIIKRAKEFFGDFYDLILLKKGKEELKTEFESLTKYLDPMILRAAVMGYTDDEKWLQRVSTYQNKYVEIEKQLELMAGNNLKDSVGDMMGFLTEASARFVGGRVEALKRRSQFMSICANQAAQAGMKGVWKVGDQHAQDMRDEKWADSFNLLTHVEFEEGFSKYCSEQEQREGSKKKKKKHRGSEELQPPGKKRKLNRD